MTDRYDRLRTLCETPGISGCETLVRRYFEQNAGDGGELLHDNMGRCCGVTAAARTPPTFSFWPTWTRSASSWRRLPPWAC